MNVKMMMVAVIAFVLAGCTDAQRAGVGTLGEEATVTCYSGGVQIFNDDSTGKVWVTDSGLTFKSKKTKSYVRTNADCIVLSKG